MLRYHGEVWNSEKKRYFYAIIGAITDMNGSVVVVHLTFLERVEDAWVKSKSLDRRKRILGPYSGNYIQIARGAHNVPLTKINPGEMVVLGEEIETCLSVALSCPDHRILCVGSLPNFGLTHLPKQLKNVLLLADNDNNNDARAGCCDSTDTRVARSRRPIPCGE